MVLFYGKIEKIAFDERIDKNNIYTVLKQK